MNPVSMSITETARVLGIGRTTTYSLINSGALQTLKIGRRTLVKAASVQALVERGAA
jgi:excisionase family DNA binding protein